MYEYLNDTTFLSLLDKAKIQTKYIKITVLTFDEKPIQEIQGVATSGTLNVNGQSAVRRTITLTMAANVYENDLTNIDNLISINKKIKVEVGYKNPFLNYSSYGDIIWFPCGLFIISSASISSSTSGISISISGKDKMCLLDGSVGGTLPASVTFHEIYEYDDDGNIFISYPTIFQIIQEAVNHYGKEPINNIIISGIEETAKQLVKYNGDSPIWFSDDYSSFIISDTPVEGFQKNKYSFGQDIGYMETDFTYPGELVLGAGDSVQTLLDKICTTLGNYEYFYDLDGRFIFQEIKNYLNTSYTPIVNLENGSYIKSFSDTKYAYSLTDSETVVSFNNNPKFDNIKNDFIVWGQRTTSSGSSINIRYHLAIDEKPNLDLATMYMWEIKKDNSLLRYEYTMTEEQPQISNVEINLIGKPSNEWREELYRQALENYRTSGQAGDYDTELLAEWRKLYDTTNSDWETVWKENFSSAWEGWNPNVYLDPGTLDYWLDFIDSPIALSSYSVNMIGRRTKVVNNTNIKSIYSIEVPDIIFVLNPGDKDELSELIDNFNRSGQLFCLLNENQIDYFTTSSSGATAYDNIRELLYQYLTFNTNITITCLPKYYLEPNNLIYVQDKKSGISGTFVIQSFSLPLAYSGTMSITATEALTRV